PLHALFLSLSLPILSLSPHSLSFFLSFRSHCTVIHLFASLAHPLPFFSSFSLPLSISLPRTRSLSLSPSLSLSLSLSLVLVLSPSLPPLSLSLICFQCDSKCFIAIT